MKTLTITDLIETYSKNMSKFCIYMSINTKAYVEEVMETAPFIERSKVEDLLACSTDNKIVLVFDTVKEMEECFNQIKDTGAVYAVTFEEGKITDEI